jgi:hypothetical protein
MRTSWLWNSAWREPFATWLCGAFSPPLRVCAEFLRVLCRTELFLCHFAEASASQHWQLLPPLLAAACAAEVWRSNSEYRVAAAAHVNNAHLIARACTALCICTEMPSQDVSPASAAAGTVGMRNLRRLTVLGYGPVSPALRQRLQARMLHLLRFAVTASMRVVQQADELKDYAALVLFLDEVGLFARRKLSFSFHVVGAIKCWLARQRCCRHASASIGANRDCAIAEATTTARRGRWQSGCSG